MVEIYLFGEPIKVIDGDHIIVSDGVTATRTPMTTAQLAAREPTNKIYDGIQELARCSGFARARIFEIISQAIESEIERDRKEQNMLKGDAIRALEELRQEIRDLVAESVGVTGLHRNGDIALWDELLPGGEFERLTNMED